MNRKLFISVIALIILVYTMQPSDKQANFSIAPSCFEHEECKVQIEEGYCDVEYQCISGKCYSHQIRCPEICDNGIDDDFDSKIDCRDFDCYNSIHCPCSRADYNQCILEQCYCPEGLNPRWAVAEEGHWCACIR